MEDNLILFSSVTSAMRSRDLLRKNAIKSSVVRTPVGFKTKSCGYSLFVPENFNRALDIIGSHGISVLGTAAVGRR
ncbi:MAG: DUF3343 domain-containing protein [Clostridiales bacterium]|nr:DUF3343 domain-containing protein [Clostridiales bacterium]